MIAVSRAKDLDGTLRLHRGRCRLIAVPIIEMNTERLPFIFRSTSRLVSSPAGLQTPPTDATKISGRCSSLNSVEKEARFSAGLRAGDLASGRRDTRQWGSVSRQCVHYAKSGLVRVSHWISALEPERKPKRTESIGLVHRTSEPDHMIDIREMLERN
jgi:hypothetical protein